MARKVADLLPHATDAEYETRVDGAIMPLEDKDTETAWDEWNEDLRTSGTGGKVRAYKLPTDAEGNPVTNAKGARQSYLGAWEHAQYDYDGLLQMLTRKFLRPGESAFVRLTGYRAGSGGIQFNKIVSIQRDATDTEASAPVSGGVDLTGVLRALNEQQQRTADMMERLLSRPNEGGISPATKELFIAALPTLGTILAAWIGRPAQKSDLAGLVDVMLKLKDASNGGDGGGGSDDDSLTGLIKAVAPDGLKLLTTLAAQRSPQPLQNPRRIAARPVHPQNQPVPTAPPISSQPSGGANLGDSPAGQNPAHSSDAQTTAIRTETNPMLAQLKPQLAELCGLAEQGADAAEVAQLTMNLLPDDEAIDAQLYALVATPKAFAQLQVLEPRMKQHAEWFEKLRVAMLGEFTAADDEAAPPADPAPVN